MTPRPPNRPRKTGKLTPGKNPSTTGSAGRSDPARDACGRPRAFHLLVFHTSYHWLVFGETARLMEGQKLAHPPSTLSAVFRVGLISFFSAKLGPVWPKPASDRAKAGRSPAWGGNRLYGASWGQTGWLGWFCGNCFGAVVFRFQCRKERKGRLIPLEGSERDLRHLPGLFQGCKEAMCKGVLFSFHTICRRFCLPKHKMRKCAPRPVAPLHPSFFSQPIPLVGQADGLHIAS